MNSTAARKSRRSAAQRARLQRQMKEANEQLILSSVRQHELMEAVEKTNTELHAEIAERERRGYVVGEETCRNHLRPEPDAGRVVLVQLDILAVTHRAEREIGVSPVVDKQPCHEGAGAR